MPSRVVVNNMTTQHKVSIGITNAFPDVCKTPAPPAPNPVPIPYPNVGLSTMAALKVTMRVKDHKQQVVVKGACYTITNGDQPGIALGVISNKIMGTSKIMNQSFNVKFENKGVGRLSDPHGNNGGSKSNVPAPAEGQPPMSGMGASAQKRKEACERLKSKHVPEDKRPEVAHQCGMTATHAEGISGYCMKSGNSVTFRSGNKSQVKKIMGKGPDGKPFPGKPMSVKNKSVNLDKRPDSMKWPDGTVDEALARKVKDNDLEGFVGVYDKHGKLRGVRTTDGAVPIDNIPPVPNNTYVGDYDAHDMFGPDGSRITGNTAQEKDMIGELNGAMGRDGTPNAPDMVCHGPQANYTEYCEAKGITPNPDLQKPDLSPKEPLLAFDKNGEMYKLETEADLDDYYTCKGAVKPAGW